MARPNNSLDARMKESAPGFLGYLAIFLWFLLTIATQSNAYAEPPAPLPAAIAPATAPIIVTPADILPEIEAALVERGASADGEITFANPDLHFVMAPGAAPIDNVSFSPRSGRFVIRLSREGGRTPVSIAGFTRSRESLPVLTRPLARGEVITEGDIEFTDAAVANPGAYVTDAAGLIGMEARRPLRARAPLRRSDISTPVLVHKGAMITVAYAAEGLRITHQGVALSSGAKGDVISVRNIQSDRVLKGVIDGENFVRIAAPRARQTQLEG